MDVDHFSKCFKGIISSTMGIKLWLDPQISEHCPKYKPGRVASRVVWFKRPGIASVFNPREGTAQECKTSSDEISIRIVSSAGKITRLSTSNKRSWPGFNSEVGTM